MTACSRSLARSIRARARATPSRSTRAITCPGARPCTAATASLRTPGASTRTRSGWAIRIRWDPWTFEVGYRHYTQGNADFYSDLFERANQQNFLARDKELSTFVSQTLSVGATYDFLPNGWRFIKKGTLNLRYDRIEFEYEDFRDARFSLLPADDANFRAAGAEPFYTFGANVIQAFVSVWF